MYFHKRLLPLVSDLVSLFLLDGIRPPLATERPIDLQLLKLPINFDFFFLLLFLLVVSLPDLLPVLVFMLLGFDGEESFALSGYLKPTQPLISLLLHL